MDEVNIDLKNLDIDSDKVASFRHKKFGDQYLITNDFGHFHLLDSDDFKDFLEGKLDESSELSQSLERKGFIKNVERLDELTERYVKRRSSLQQGPGLHIMVVTQRCNYNCIYCQASAKNMDNDELDMDKETAKKAVDRAFESTSDHITIEFQGGEPLVNWEVVKFIIKYAEKKSDQLAKKVNFGLVTNLSLMTKERLQFLIDHRVGPCTSLDGPEKLHNKNRPYPDGNSYQEVAKWIDEYRKLMRKFKSEDKEISKFNALLTVSRFSLKYPKEIIDEYRNFGFDRIDLRPLSYLGYSGGEARERIGYSVEEFLEFWRKGMDYILELNQKGNFFAERGSVIKLTKMLTDKDPGFTDLASPCGACVGQVVYNYNGDLYTCDEGRMVEGDEFKLGNLEDTSYEEMITSDTCKTMLNASTLENQSCDMCAYKPYCGVCPVKNYALKDTLFPQMPNTDWCKLRKVQFDYLFAKMKTEEYKEIMEGWVEERWEE